MRSSSKHPVHSEDEAVAEGERRARIILSSCLTANDPMEIALKPQSSAITMGIHDSLSRDWRLWRTAVVTRLCKIGYIELLCDTLIYADRKSDKRITLREMNIYYGLLTTASDCNKEACKIMADKDLINLYTQNLAKLTAGHDAESKEETDARTKHDNFIHPLLNINSLQNIARHYGESKYKFDEAKTVEVLRFFLKSDNEGIQLAALAAIACMLSDSQESDALLDEHSLIPKLVHILEEAWKNVKFGERAYSGFAAEEIIEILTILAVNDHNKVKIAEANAIPTLTLTLRGGNELEQSRAIDCLWALAFDENIRQRIVETEACVSTIEKIGERSSNLQLRIKANRAVVYIKLGKDGFGTQKEVSKSKEEADSNKDEKHIFLSYCWANQEIVLTICQLLRDKGYKVWMDLDNMTNNTVESMAEGVENAFLVLICYSEAYRQSNMCRTEAEYVFRLGKPFIPINLQHRYFPTGWLGIIIGARLFVDFSLQKHPLEKVTTKLYQEIENIGGRDGDKARLAANAEDELSQNGTSQQHSCETCPCCLNINVEIETRMKKLENEITAKLLKKLIITSSAEKRVKKWTSANVQTWLNTEGLSGKLPNDFDGRALVSLHEIRIKAFDVYQSAVSKLAGESNVKDGIKLMAAIDKLLRST